MGRTYDRFEDRAIFVDGVVPRVDCARAYPGGRSGIFNIHDFSVNYLSVLPATGSHPISSPPAA